MNFLDFFISPAHAQAAGGAGGGLLTFLPLLLMLGVMYFLFIRPQQKRVKEHAAMVEALKKGDEVVTNGGLGGTIANVHDAFITMKVADNVEVNVQKQAIATLLPKGTLKRQAFTESFNDKTTHMNKYPLWKYILLGAVLLAGSLFALPNLFGDYKAVQVTARDGLLDDSVKLTVRQAIKDAGLTDVELREDDNRFMALFTDDEEQLKARDVIDDALESRRHIVAMNLVSAAPAWLRSFAKPMYLGLDLRGGVHFLMEVDMDATIKSSEERYASDWKAENRRQKIRGVSVGHRDGKLTARFKTAEQREQMLELYRRNAFDLNIRTRDEGEFFYIDANLTEQAADEEKRSALQQNITTLRNRVNELGVAEPIIVQQGLEQIVIQLPGVQDPARAREILGATATLEYRLVEGTPADWFSAQDSGRARPGTKLYTQRDDGSPVLLSQDIIVTGDQIKGASSGIDQQSGSPAVFVNLDGKGAKRMQAVTAENVGNLMAVVYIENLIDYKIVDDERVKVTERVEEVINTATIRDVLSHRFQTTGLGANEAANLALLLRAGALKAPVEIVEERTVGPSLGADNIRQGFLSAVAGLFIVLAFMAWYYRVFGLIAGAALVINLVLIIAVLSTLQATLTMPGIAGIVLTTGMAVDANVLIFERIREELRAGTTVQSAIDAGYEKAFSTIADANITTLIAAVVLFSLGTGPIKGFAVTLSIGILTSMFTAILGTRALVNLIYGNKRGKELAI